MEKELESQAVPTTHLALGTNQKKIPVKKWNKARVAIAMLFTTCLVITLWTFATLDMRGLVIAEAIPQFLTNMQRIFLEPSLSHRTTFGYLFSQLGITLGLAVLSTILGAIISFFLAVFAARNLSHPTVSAIVRGFISFVRAVPSILLILVFTLVIGLGPEAAIVGLVFQGLAFLTKAYSETIEEIDKGVIEALRASGASWWQIIFQAVLPSCITAFLSWTFIRFEVNFGHAIALGAAAGAGGIGFRLILSSTFYFDLHEVGVIAYMIIIVATVLELISMRLKNGLAVKN